MSIKLKSLLVTISCLSLCGAGCDQIKVYTGFEPDYVVDPDRIPIVITDILPQPGEPVYRVCKDEDTYQKIYSWEICVKDGCQISYYDNEGKTLEQVPKGSGTAVYAYEPKTKTKDCVRTTPEYFAGKISDKKTLP